MVGEDVKTYVVLRNVRLLNTWWLPGAMHDAPPLSSSRRRLNRSVPSSTSSYWGTSARARVRKQNGKRDTISHTLMREDTANIGLCQNNLHLRVGLLYLSCRTSPFVIAYKFGVSV